jgi:hypothetical protein
MVTWTQADVDHLKKMISLGASTARFADRTVTFRSLQEMMDLLAIMEGEVNAASGKQRTRAIRFQTSKGF